jgi:hypothetical protein
VADSGRSIFLEQSFEQRGSQRHFRWEIPYQYIVRLEKRVEPPQASASSSGDPATAAAPSAEASPSSAEPESPESKMRNSASSVSSGGGAPGILPLQNRPKTA